MAKKINKNKQVSLRISSEIHSKLTTYANAHSLSLTDACVRLIENGLIAEYQQLATKDDIERLMLDNKRRDSEEQTRLTLLLDAIKNQPIAVQQLPPVDSDTKKTGLFQRLFKN